jgi:serine/threonine-protein kinase
LSALKICPVCSTEYPANERFCPRDGTALRSQAGANDLVGSVIAERYHVLKKLGEGGMGQVYLAEHVKMGRKSAVKVMNPGMVQNVDAISRFNREAANASRINHPNVAGIYDFGETPDGLIYLAMEFVEGEPLTSVIKHHGALPPLRASEIARQVAEGLSVAHDMGIVHRDLKPDNIMIGRGRNGADLVKVVDFGIAKAAASDQQKVTKTGMVVGTPEYMSPEQLSGDPLDARSDIYSLALVTFNMLTGKLPFPGESMQETMIMRLTDDPQPLGAMKPEVAWPADLQAVMDKALARDVNQRYRNASEFARDLVEAIDRMPATSITTMGTQVVGSAKPVDPTAATIQVQVPPTRVASKDGGGRRPPEDLSGRVPAAAPTPSGPPAKSRTPLMVGVGIAAVVVVLAGMKLMSRDAAANSKGQEVQPPSTVSQGTSTPATDSAPASIPASSTPTTSSSRQREAVDLGPLLKHLDDTLAVDPDTANARSVLRQLATATPKTTEEIVLAAVVKAAAYANLGDTVRVCSVLREVAVRAKGTEQANIVKQTLETCPPSR